MKQEFMNWRIFKGWEAISSPLNMIKVNGIIKFLNLEILINISSIIKLATIAANLF